VTLHRDDIHSFQIWSDTVCIGDVMSDPIRFSPMSVGDWYCWSMKGDDYLRIVFVEGTLFPHLHKQISMSWAKQNSDSGIMSIFMDGGRRKNNKLLDALSDADFVTEKNIEISSGVLRFYGTTSSKGEKTPLLNRIADMHENNIEIAEGYWDCLVQLSKANYVVSAYKRFGEIAAIFVDKYKKKQETEMLPQLAAILGLGR